MGDLERDALVLRAVGGQLRGAEVLPTGTEVHVAVEATRDREELRALDSGRVVLEALLLRPGRHLRLQLRAERLLRGRTLVREDAHREDDENRGDDRHRPAREATLGP